MKTIIENPCDELVARAMLGVGSICFVMGIFISFVYQKTTSKIKENLKNKSDKK